MKPKRTLRNLLAIASSSLLAVSSASATTFTWTQTATGSQDWTVDGNWDGSLEFVSSSGNELAFLTSLALASGNGNYRNECSGHAFDERADLGRRRTEQHSRVEHHHRRQHLHLDDRRWHDFHGQSHLHPRRWHLGSGYPLHHSRQSHAQRQTTHPLHRRQHQRHRRGLFRKHHWTQRATASPRAAATC